MIAWLRTFFGHIVRGLTLQNIAGSLIVLGISLVYFSSNTMTAGGVEKAKAEINAGHVVFFLFLECMFLMILLFRDYKKDPLWYLAALIFIAAPFIRVGESIDFSMRTTIPALMVLMIWTAKNILEKQGSFRPLIVVIFILGMFTPLYEMNRSIYRTYDYYQHRAQADAQPRPDPQVAILEKCYPEKNHPNSFLADDFVTLSNFEQPLVSNFVADIRDSIYGMILR